MTFNLLKLYCIYLHHDNYKPRICQYHKGYDVTGPFFKVTAAIFAVILLQNKSLCLQFSSSSPLLSNSVPPQTSRCSWSSLITRALLHHFSLHNVGVLHLAIKQLFLSGTFWLLTITKHVSQRNAFPFTENHDIIKLTKLF